MSERMMHSLVGSSRWCAHRCAHRNRFVRLFDIVELHSNGKVTVFQCGRCKRLIIERVLSKRIVPVFSIESVASNTTKAVKEPELSPLPLLTVSLEKAPLQRA